jgi:hypothetical protein
VLMSTRSSLGGCGRGCIGSCSFGRGGRARISRRRPFLSARCDWANTGKAITSARDRGALRRETMFRVSIDDQPGRHTLYESPRPTFAAVMLRPMDQPEESQRCRSGTFRKPLRRAGQPKRSQREPSELGCTAWPAISIGPIPLTALREHGTRSLSVMQKLQRNDHQTLSLGGTDKPQPG